MRRTRPTARLAVLAMLMLASSAGATTAGFDLNLDELLAATPRPGIVAGGFIPPGKQARAGMNPAPTIAGESAGTPSSVAVDRRLQESRVEIGLYPDPGIHHQPKSFPSRIPDNFVGIVKAPLLWDGRDWRRFGLGVAAVGAVALFDDEINSWMDGNRTDGAVQAAETIRPLGQEGALILLGATWLAGRHFDRPKMEAVAADGLESAFFAAGIITPLLKAVTGRVRPRNTDNSGDFNGTSKSFPSGEATLAFSIASVVAAHSEKKWVDGLAWGTAGLLGLNRMVLDGHWASDVLAGALIGTAVGQWVVRRNRPELEPGLRFDVAPTFDDSSYGVSVHLRF